jgi:predicted ABC-type ATPase
MPTLYIIGGPNGAGKSTLARTLLPEYLKVVNFVNADSIAGGLSAYDPESVAVAAGRIMLRRIHELADANEDFAFETTLASKYFIQFVQDVKKRGYSVTLIYVWLKSVSLAQRRIRHRVAQGGHDIPKDVVRRRYGRGMANLRSSYIPLADVWYVFDNSASEPVLVAERQMDSEPVVHLASVWKKLWESA